MIRISKGMAIKCAPANPAMIAAKAAMPRAISVMTLDMVCPQAKGNEVINGV